MTYKIEVEAISPDRTRMYFRDNDAPEYWDIEIVTDDRARSWYTVHHDGWVVYELSAREVIANNRGVIASECFVTSRAREEIPAEILSHLPIPHRIAA